MKKTTKRATIKIPDGFNLKVENEILKQDQKERKVESHSAEGELKQNGVTITPLKQNGVTITPLKQNGVTITPSIYPDEYIKNFFSAHRINVDESETNLYFSQDGKKYKLDIKKLLLLGLLEEVK